MILPGRLTLWLSDACNPLLNFICLQITHFVTLLLQKIRLRIFQVQCKVPRPVQVIPKRKIEDIRDAKGHRWAKCINLYKDPGTTKWGTQWSINSWMLWDGTNRYDALQKALLIWMDVPLGRMWWIWMKGVGIRITFFACIEKKLPKLKEGVE